MITASQSIREARTYERVFVSMWDYMRNRETYLGLPDADDDYSVDGHGPDFTYMYPYTDQDTRLPGYW